MIGFHGLSLVAHVETTSHVAHHHAPFSGPKTGDHEHKDGCRAGLRLGLAGMFCAPSADSTPEGETSHAKPHATLLFSLSSHCQGYNKAENRLQIQTCANQDPLESMTGGSRSLLVLKHRQNCPVARLTFPPFVPSGLVPLLGIDVWEHAYYLDYKNARPDYLKVLPRLCQTRVFTHPSYRTFLSFSHSSPPQCTSASSGHLGDCQLEERH